jgi:hypothetical protein
MLSGQSHGKHPTDLPRASTAGLLDLASALGDALSSKVSPSVTVCAETGSACESLKVRVRARLKICL